MTTNICVIGAGVVGCATAYQLLRLGYGVTLIDAASEPGTGTSFGNGGQLSYSFVEPLASPGTLRGLPKMLVSADSPLRFKLMPDPRQWSWGIRFLLACTGQRSRDGTRKLLELASLSRETLDTWMAAESWEFGYRMNGKLVLCPSESSMTQQRAQVDFQRQFGRNQEMVSAQECVRLEPALAPYADAFVGGVWTQDECVGDSYLLCQQLLASIVRLGGVVRLGEPVRELAVEGGRVRGVKTSQGEAAAAAVVLCAGNHTSRLAAGAGVSVPIYPIKGYSLTLDIRDTQRAPRVSVTDLGRKTVFAPLGRRLRVAAMAEVVGDDLSISDARMTQIVESVEKVFPGACDFADLRPWAGLRPATPDSVPRIGPTRVAGLFINSGHGALGFTLAAGSATQLGRQLLQHLPPAGHPRIKEGEGATSSLLGTHP